MTELTEKNRDKYYCQVCHTPTKRVGYTTKCSFCGHIFRFFEEDTIHFHAESYRKKFLRTSNEIVDGKITDKFHENRKRIVAKRLALIGKFLNKENSLLDIGGGAGTFAKEVRNHVKNVRLTEVSPMLVDHCTQSGLDAHKMSIDELSGNECYDVVTAWHVLEHIEDVKKAAEKLRVIFNRYLIIEIPKERGIPEAFDGHHQFFTDESLQNLFSGLVVRQYSSGAQPPSRLVVFEHPRIKQRIRRRTSL